MALIFSIKQSVEQGKKLINEKIEEEFKEVKNTLLIAVQYTKRFGVKNPLEYFFDPSVMTENDKGAYKTLSKEYERWYSFWTDWKNSLKYEEWLDIDKALIEDSSDIPHLPNKKWFEN